MSNRFYRDNGDMSMSIDISSLGDWADNIDETIAIYREALLNLTHLTENQHIALSGLADQLKELTIIVKRLGESQASMTEHCADLALSVMELRDDNTKLRSEVSSLKYTTGGNTDE